MSCVSRLIFSRFSLKAPQPVTPWDGIRSATAHGPICRQRDLFFDFVETGSEDCLYLNVYTPSLEPTKPLPVMFWIHGGGFSSGSGNSHIYGPDFLVNQNVVLVTINYRLEALGFLCLDTEDVPGNAGMKDQVAGLRWVQKNIQHFGGDANNVTIFGESAGGASVAYHLVSPMTKGLFKRAILQSGQNLSNWSRCFEPRLRAEAIARSLGEDTTDDNELYQFFKSQPVDKLVGITAPITVEEEFGIRINLILNVTDEKQFGDNERYFYGDVYERLRNGIHEGVEVMIGYTTHEGAIQFNFLKEEGTFDKYNKFLQCFVPIELLLQCSVKDQMHIGKKLKEHYFGNKKVSIETVDPFIKFISMQILQYDILQYAKILAENNTNRLFVYKFDIDTERNKYTEHFKARAYTKGKCVCHCDDLLYLFNDDDVPVDINADSYKMIKNVTKLWTDFAKVGYVSSFFVNNTSLNLDYLPLLVIF